MMMSMKYLLLVLAVFHMILDTDHVLALREFRLYSNRYNCSMSEDANWPFAYRKYDGQEVESKGRVNSNLQDFRHECNVLGGRSKCHICEVIDCDADGGSCALQLQGVDYEKMSGNIPVLSDTSWGVGGAHKFDFGGEDVTHFCVFLSGGDCLLPSTTDFSQCSVRCFGYGFNNPAMPSHASNRSTVDLYPGQERWADDGRVDLWEYPKNCDDLLEREGTPCTYTGRTPSFNPQGFTFNYAGSGEQGFADGSADVASFYGPEDVALNENGVVFVADTKNHAIRMVSGDTVTTIAGQGPDVPGYEDGDCVAATFNSPKGLDVITIPDTNTTTDNPTTVIIVADTGNHRIRRIDLQQNPYSCRVRCLTGLCGNNSLSQSLFQFQSRPLTGFADGNGLEARFSSPESVAFMEGGDNFVIADTGNFLIRIAFTNNGTTATLAGTIVDGPKDPLGNPLAGCPPPCLQGAQGFEDGDLWTAKFYNPMDVTRGPNNTVWVADEQRVRIVELPRVITELYTIRSRGRVSTIAGYSLQGHEDGFADKANFFYPSGLFVTEDNIAYVADLASCRIRRVTPLPSVAEPVTCSATVTSLVRPSGCTSFDQPIDKIGRKVSRVEKNVQYNIGNPYIEKIDRGKYIKNCVGVPPHDRLDKHNISQGDNLVIDDHRTVVNEDSEQGTAIIVSCPTTCTASADPSAIVRGNTWYSDDSSVCLAAVHDGKINPIGGIIQIVMQRRNYLAPLDPFLLGTTSNGVTSLDILISSDRIFRIESYNVSNYMVHTVAGHPSAPLENGCGYAEGQPAQTAYFTQPSGIAGGYVGGLTDSDFIYIADTGNNRIRALSAVCTQICENKGRCIGPDICECVAGWEGVDCARPICSTPCGLNTVCTSPDTCTCKPGYIGADCSTPTCIQPCLNGGTCSAPNTCSCVSGWFDSNCTTPVCTNTCANGGNCTAPNTCACPSDWQGSDCRVPVCAQTCLNSGLCIAPHTCSCPPQWTNFDCSAPVCHQGYFIPNSLREGRAQTVFDMEIHSIPAYKNCDLQGWCDVTKEFECDQPDLKNDVIRVASGPAYRKITGRKEPPNQCMPIELPINYKIPFELVLSDGSKTGHRRYAPNSRYTSNPANPWRGYEDPVDDHTGPWEYEEDRQVAFVNWLNVSQGVYVCANGGSCLQPSVCACAPGWVGFDCRTPVCGQGYFENDQEDFVSGEKTDDEIEKFRYMMEDVLNKTDGAYDLLQWDYSNPDYEMEFERYSSASLVIQEIISFPGVRYRGEEMFDAAGNPTATYQGGYRCSNRAKTQWENIHNIHEHPNFFSRYMDKELMDDGNYYTYWDDVGWPSTHRKSRILDRYVLNKTFVYTNEGYKRMGIWHATGTPWLYGVCVIEFARNCSESPEKEYDIRTQQYNVKVQDTDVAYRPIITYSDEKVNFVGRWKEKGGTCVDQVVRGCANNGTCIAPDVCRCATGWTGNDCQIPLCTQTCMHQGNCTNPDICTCERGWSGYDCSIPLCAQECNNGGVCVAPDTCQCSQWPSIFIDGREPPEPLFRDISQDPLLSGWTGYDCATPICVQAESFVVNVKTRDRSLNFFPMGGRGADALLQCKDPVTGFDQPRCPQFDPSNDANLDQIFVTGNDGTSFQTGCGFDPFESGCCVLSKTTVDVDCFLCEPQYRIESADGSTYYCESSGNELIPTISGQTTAKANFQKDEYGTRFVSKYGNFVECGRFHSPRDYNVTDDVPNSGVAKYYTNLLRLDESNFNYQSTTTSNKYLCNVDFWYQGDYINSAGLENVTGVGSVHGLKTGRHIRINTPNIQSGEDGIFRGPEIRGEGVYQCANGGSCIGPDICTCTDGYLGYDCKTPLCRHLQQPTATVSSCLNGGICISKDNCTCIKTGSVLWQVHPDTARGLTGWTGTDCSMPICIQGYYDPFCSDLPQAPGGEGCFRCANSGNCTAPDTCTCAPGWAGFDCRTPVCEAVADPLTRLQIGTSFEEKVVDFETDPCALKGIYGINGWKGRKYARGNCSQPNQCTCLCKEPYNKKMCQKAGINCDGPWQDNMVSIRNVLTVRGPEYTFGSTDCFYGFEGNVDDFDHFTTCHQTIYKPTSTERDSLMLILVFSILGFFGIAGYQYASARIKKHMRLAKIERRRSKRSSEESLLGVGGSGGGSGAFRQSTG